MELLTEETTTSNTIREFCQSVISRHSENWPPEEQVLVQEIVDWFGSNSFLSRDALKQLCRSKGVNLSFVEVPWELRGLNCSFQDKKEIVLAEREMAPGADLHTLFHEFREMLEHEFSELGYTTLHPGDSLEVQAELFAAAGRIKCMEKEFPAFLEMASSVEKKWLRYIVYALVCLFTAVSFFSCIYMRQMEEVGYEAERERSALPVLSEISSRF